MPPIKLLFITLIISFSGSWHFGYELTCINPTEQIFEHFLNYTYTKNYQQLSENHIHQLWSVLANLPSIGCLFGTVVSRTMLENVGRKNSFFIAIPIHSIGVIFSALAYSILRWEIFAAGRFLSGTGNVFTFLSINFCTRFHSGLGIGIMISLQPIYFSEISPDEHRGQINTMTGVMVEFGYSFGALIALPSLLGTLTLWPHLFYLELIPNIVAIFILMFLHESPKFLMAKKRDAKLICDSLVYFGHIDVEVQ